MSNPFDAAVLALEREQLGAAQDGVRQGLELDGQRQGRALELGGRAGLPTDVAERNLDELERAERLNAIPWQEVDRSPALRTALSDPAQASVLVDDVQALLDLRSALGGTPPAGEATPTPQPPTAAEPSLLEVLGARFSRGRRTAFAIPAAARPLILEGLGVRAATLDERRAWEIVRSAPQAPAEREGALDDVLGAPLEQLPILARTAGSALVTGGVGAAIGAGAGSVLPGLGTAAGATGGFALGARAGSALSVFDVESGNAFAEFSALVDDQGQPLPQDLVAAGAVTVGAINSGLELVGFQSVASRIPGLSKVAGAGRKAVSAAVAKQMKNPALRGQLVAGARSVLKAVGVEVATEVAQEAVNVEGGRLLSGEGLGLTGEEAGRLGETALQTALGVGPLVGAGQAVRTTLDRIATSKQNAAQLQAAQQAVTAAKARELSPAVFRTLTDALAREAGIEEVGIPADALLEAYGAQGATIDQVLADLPELSARQIEAAAVTGGDVLVPVGRYFETLEPRFGAELLEDLRLRPEDLTGREAQRAEAGLEASVERELARAAAPSVAEQQVDVAQEQLGLDPLFTDPAAAAMTPEEFEAYRAAAANVRVSAQLQLQKQIDRAAQQAELVRKSEERTHARVRADFTDEVTREVDARPVFQADRFLRLPVAREKGAEAPPVRLDADRVASLYGEDWLEQLGQKKLTQKNGLHPDLVADLFGFDSGLELVRALLAADRDAAIADGVEAKMVERFGDYATDGRLEDDAIDAVGDEAIRLLQIEERALARLAGDGQPTPRAVAQSAARRLVPGFRVADLNPARFRQQAQTAGRLAVEALAARDFGMVQEQKRRQLLNVALEQEVRTVRGEVAKANFSRFSKKSTRDRIDSAGGGYLEQVDGLLERFFLRPPAAPASVAARQPLGAWIAEHEAAGEDVQIPDRIANPAYTVAWRYLSVEDLRGLRESLENLEDLAKKQIEISTRTETAQLESVEQRIADEVEASGLATNQPARLTKTALEQGKSLARGIDASLSRVEFLIDSLSGGAPDSALRRWIWDPLTDAQGEYNKRLDDYAKRFAALRRGVLGEQNARDYHSEIVENRLTDIDGRPLRLTKWNVLMIAANTGNDSNLAKLLGGFSWDAGTVQAVLDQHMTESDWRFVQGVWDLFETLWPEIAAQSKRMSGVAPPRIEAQEVRTRFGTFRGGYFPVAYDYERSRTGQRAEVRDLLPGVAEGFTRPTVGHGFTKSRTKVEAPLRIDQAVIPNHLDQVLLYLTHAEAIQDAARVLGRPKVDQAISRALGPEFSFSRFWVPWLQGIARDTADPGPLTKWAQVARWARLRGTVFKLAFRETTLVAQLSGFFNGLRQLQQHVPSGAAGYLMDGAWRALGRGNPLEAGRTYADVWEASPFMASRVGNVDRDMRDIVRTASRRQRTTDNVMAFAMNVIARVQLHLVDMPVWLAAHRAAVETMGMTEDRAVRFADSMVRMSQGSGTKLDQSAFERGTHGGEFLKAMALFYSYNNLVYNQLRASGRDVRRVRDLPSFFASFLLYVTLPGLYSAITYAIATGRMPDPDEDDFDREIRAKLIDATIGGAPASVPVLREAWGSVQSGRIRTASAIDVFLTEAVDLVQVKDETDLMFDVLRTGALYGALPGGDRILRGVESALRGEEK